MTIIEAKLRRVGSSLGILIPKEIVLKKRIKEGQIIEVILPQIKNLKLLDEAVGSAKEFKYKFKRDKKDRF